VIPTTITQLVTRPKAVSVSVKRWVDTCIIIMIIIMIVIRAIIIVHKMKMK